MGNDAQGEGRFSRGLVLAAFAGLAVSGGYVLSGATLGVAGQWWVERRTQFPHIGGMLLFAVVATVYLGAAAIFERTAGGGGWKRRASFVALGTALYAMVLFAQAGSGPAGRAEFAAPVFKDDAAGFFLKEATRIENGREYLTGFARRLAEYGTHYRETVRVNNNPPGTTMLLYGALGLARRSPGTAKAAWQALFGRGSEPPNETAAGTVLGSWIMLLAAALGFVPAWLVARSLGGEEGYLAAAVGMLAGSMVLFVPGKDTLQVTLFLWMWWFCLRGRQRREWIWGAALGLAAAAAFFFTLATAVVVVVLLAGGATLAAREGKAGWLKEGKFWAGAAAGLLVGFGMIWAASGYNSFSGLWACYENHAAFYEYFPRTYWKWALYNPVEYALFLGGPMAAAVGYCVVGRIKPGKKAQGRDAWAYMVGALGVMMALDVWGKNLSETNRLWVFFMPFVAIGAAAIVRRGKRGFADLVVLGALQVGTIMVLKTYLDVWRVEDILREIGLIP